MKINELNPGTKLELVVYDENDERIVPSFVSEIEWIEGDSTAYIAAPIREGIIYPVRTGSAVDILFISKDDLYKFKAKITGRYHKDNIAILIAEAAGEIEKMQRREFFRFDCSVPVKYRVINSVYPDENEKIPFISSITRDLSGGGICVMVEEKIERDKLVECELILGENRTIKFIGKVLRLTKYDTEGKYKFEIGLTFKKIQNRDREAIIGFIFQEQRKLRKKGLI